MNIIFVDDSFPFDGHSPNERAMGAAEKAFASLPGALAKRGHAVRVYNRCDFPVLVDGAGWYPLDEGTPPANCEVLVAFRKPSLLDFIGKAERRFLWLTSSAGYLDKARASESLATWKPMLLVHGLEHQATVPRSAQSLRSAILPHGIGSAFTEAEAPEPAQPPRAVVTTHPLAGLDWLLDLWVTRVKIASPRAELHVFSAILDRGASGVELPEEYQPILEKCLSLDNAGVVIRQPMADPDMAEVYRTARVHLYPGHAGEVYCGTLAESQAVGLPAVARPLGATGERIENGLTGFLAPDDEAFANLAIRMLDDDQTFSQLSARARDMQRQWTWDKVAGEFEALLG